MRALVPAILLCAIAVAPFAAQPVTASGDPVACYPTFNGGTICFIRVGGGCAYVYSGPPQYGPPEAGKCRT